MEIILPCFLDTWSPSTKILISSSLVSSMPTSSVAFV
uniref:Uncharacterized protein n=1 Tax=Arundo donax TaxID=35708 RepID=A0A0A9AYJ3_ARUDO